MGLFRTKQRGKQIFKKLVRLLTVGILIFLITLAVLFFIEGLSSFVFVGQEAMKPVSLMTERLHAEYDPELGWINKPNVLLPDLYGPGIGFQTNSQRFRNEHDFAVSPPEGKKRAVCLGDSYALGWGVKNKDTWCSQLAEINSDLETVNMGQGGYGIDQAYLWYMRDGVLIKKNLVIFSIISADLFRIANRDFAGYGKPVLGLAQDGTLISKNTPVPQRMYRFPALEVRLRALKQLRICSFIEKAGISIFPVSNQPVMDPETMRSVTLRIFKNLSEQTKKEGSSLTVVYLPALWDFEDKRYDSWRKWIAEIAVKENFNFFDFVEELRKLPREEWQALYGSHAHFNEKGNRLIAEMMQERIISSGGK